MNIGGFQKVTMIDYPGKLAAIVFTIGCNFRCPFCHNPELVNPELFNPTNRNEEVLEFLNLRKGKLDAVTITGGEPTLQLGLLDFMRDVKKMGYLVKLDSNGTNPHILKDVFDQNLADYIAMDIKSPLERYDEIAKVKVDKEKIRESIKMIMNSGVDYEFRTTVVNRLMCKQDILNIGKDIKGAKRYFIQNFVASKTLNPKFMKADTLLKEDIESLKTDMLQFVNECRVR